MVPDPSPRPRHPPRPPSEEVRRAPRPRLRRPVRVGLVGTWWFNLSSAAAGESYLGRVVRQPGQLLGRRRHPRHPPRRRRPHGRRGPRLGWRPWVLALLVVGSFAVAVAFVFPSSSPAARSPAPPGRAGARQPRHHRRSGMTASSYARRSAEIEGDSSCSSSAPTSTAGATSAPGSRCSARCRGWSASWRRSPSWACSGLRRLDVRRPDLHPVLALLRAAVAYARSAQAEHLPGRAFNLVTRAQGDAVGVFHKTYRIPRPVGDDLRRDPRDGLLGAGRGKGLGRGSTSASRIGTRSERRPTPRRRWRPRGTTGPFSLHGVHPGRDSTRRRRLASSGPRSCPRRSRGSSSRGNGGPPGTRS